MLLSRPDVDNTKQLQSQIDAQYKKSGGKVELPPGDFGITGVNWYSNIKMVTAGAGCTRLYLLPGSTNPIIRVINGKNSTIAGVTLDGCRAKGMVQNVVEIINDSTKSTDNSFGFTLSHCNIINAGHHGIYAADGAWGFTVERNFIRDCWGYGIYNESTDNTFLNNNITHGELGGFYNTGGNIKIRGGKIIGCSASNVAGGGLVLQQCGRAMVSDVECQDNYFNGFVLRTVEDSSLSNCLADANGVAYRKDDQVKSRGYGFSLEDVRNCRIQGVSTNYHPSRSQVASFSMKGCTDIDMQLKESKQDGQNVTVPAKILTQK
jgi:hypothetical protein